MFKKICLGIAAAAILTACDHQEYKKESCINNHKSRDYCLVSWNSEYNLKADYCIVTELEYHPAAMKYNEYFTVYAYSSALKKTYCIADDITRKTALNDYIPGTILVRLFPENDITQTFDIKVIEKP